VSRSLDEYRAPSPASAALQQLQEEGKSLRPGQSVRLIYTLGASRARAWDLPDPPDPRSVDINRYRSLLFRAMDAILEPVQGFSQPSMAAQAVQLAFEFA
jgi:DNA polymerase elongation subunit (family B)